MKFHFASIGGGGGCGVGGDIFFNHKEKIKKLHKNLFMDDFESNENEWERDEYIEEDCDEKRTEYANNLEQNSKFFKLNHLSMPLTDTIAQFAQELSNDDQFFINDLSFLFEMSRKKAISPYAIVIALLYLKRLKTKSSMSNLDSSSVLINSASTIKSCLNSSSSYNSGLSNSELCLISILLASKYLIDEGESNELYNNDWADVCDISLKKINNLERCFLQKMEWDLYVSSDEFWSFTNDLTEKITRKKVKSQCNQCTYTDLDFLLRNSFEFSSDTIKKHLYLISKIILVCSSTLIYLTLSSFLLSSYIFYIKNQLVLSIMTINSCSVSANPTNNITKADSIYTSNAEMTASNDQKESLIILESTDDLLSKDENNVTIKSDQNQQSFCYSNKNSVNETNQWNKIIKTDEFKFKQKFLIDHSDGPPIPINLLNMHRSILTTRFRRMFS